MTPAPFAPTHPSFQPYLLDLAPRCILHQIIPVQTVGNIREQQADGAQDSQMSHPWFVLLSPPGRVPAVEISNNEGGFGS